MSSITAGSVSLSDLRRLYYGGGSDAEYTALLDYANAGITSPDILAAASKVKTGAFVAKAPVGAGNTVTTDGTFPAVIIRQPGTAGKVPAFRVVNDDDAAAGVARQYGSTYTDEFGGLRSTHYFIISGTVNGSGVIQPPNADAFMLGLYADTGDDSAVVVSRCSGSARVGHLRALRTNGNRGMEITDEGGYTFYDGAGWVGLTTNNPLASPSGQKALRLHSELVSSRMRLKWRDTDGNTAQIPLDDTRFLAGTYINNASISATDNRSFFVAPFALKVTKVYFSSQSAFSIDVTNYWMFWLRKIGAGGTTLGDVAKKGTNTVAISANASFDGGTIGDQGAGDGSTLAAGDMFDFAVLKNGSPSAIAMPGVTFAYQPI